MSQKSKSTTFLLCYFLGAFGVHRFYLNKVGTGILMLITFGGLMIWWLIDAILIAAGQMKDRDGNPLRSGAPDPDNPHAGFWVRVAAISVDTLILNLGLAVVMTGISIALPVVGIGMMGMEGMATLEEHQVNSMAMMLTGVMTVVSLIATLLYFGIQTASRHQATFGKRCFDIYVASADGTRPGLPRALWRTACYLFSTLPLYLGFVMAGLTRDKRALHDYMAGTRVLYVGEAQARQFVTGREPTTEPAPAPAPVPPRTVSVERTGAPRAPAMLMALGALLLAGAVAFALLG